MKGFKKLILATAIIAASSSSFAMQAMDDESLSATTGQDGLTITLDVAMTDLSIKYIDRDGFGATYSSAGAVIIGSGTDGINVNTTGLTIDIDAGGSAGTAAANSGMLNIGIDNPNAITIGLQNVNIGVADATATGSSTGTADNIISFDSSASLTIAAGPGKLMNIQLGNEDQGHLVVMDSDMGNISLTGMSINDVNSGGSISIATLSIANLHVKAAIDVVAGGLQIDTTGTTIGEVGIEGLQLGSGPAIGDVYLNNLNPVVVMTITGH